jgi:hypothetical protein
MEVCKVFITSKEHGENGTEFRAKISNIQGIYDAEIGGHFNHYEDSPRASCWDVNQWAKVNTQEYTIEDVYALLGNGDTDIGVEILDAMIVPHLDDDHGQWLEAMEKDRQESAREYAQMNRDYQRSSGF